MVSRFRGRECHDLLAFEEVARRLRLGTRLKVGRREVAISDIVGSLGRVDDFDGCFRPRNKRLAKAIAARAQDVATIDQPISLLQVDHAYFVEDGHKRLSAAIGDGRQEVDADVDRFETPYHVAPGTTIESIRLTSRERRFREVTGLKAAVPRQRFPLSDPDGYLELEESVKAHTLDLSHAEGRLLSPAEGARHWFETVFVPVLEIGEARRGSRLLESTTDADRFLLFRRGFEGPMEVGWRIPPRIAERGLANLDANLPPRRTGTLAHLPRRGAKPSVQLLADEPKERTSAKIDEAAESAGPAPERVDATPQMEGPDRTG